jgi:hypothetical protein
MKLAAWMTAYEVVTDERDWSVNLDIFRAIFLTLAVLPSAFTHAARKKTQRVICLERV